jgi:hypothetical protein
MKLPGYLRQVGKPQLAPDGRHAIFTIEVNRRHPGFWLLMVRIAPGVFWRWLWSRRKVKR